MVRASLGLLDTFLSYALHVITFAMAIIPPWLLRLGLTRAEERDRARDRSERLAVQAPLSLWYARSTNFTSPVLRSNA